MELQIQDLISSIKKDGIDSANQEAAAIVAEAKSKAAQILADARNEAEQTLAKAQQEAELYRKNAELSAQQAKRDATLAFGREVQTQFEKILTSKVEKAADDKALITLIGAALQGENAADYTAEVGEVTDALKEGLAQQLRAGLELRPSSKVHCGFRLAAKDGSGYFDCSEEEITQMLMPFFRDIHI